MHSTTDLSGLVLHINESEFVSDISLRSVRLRDGKLLMKSHTGEPETIQHSSCASSIAATQVETLEQLQPFYLFICLFFFCLSCLSLLFQTGTLNFTKEAVSHGKGNQSRTRTCCIYVFSGNKINVCCVAVSMTSSNYI